MACPQHGPSHVLPSAEAHCDVESDWHALPLHIGQEDPAGTRSGQQAGERAAAAEFEHSRAVDGVAVA
eukprot:6179615-Pleurochrysis_carterae.AAC.2